MVHTSDYPIFSVAVDVVAFTLVGPELSVLLIERGEGAEAGTAALPGGFVRADEDLADAARRELAEETGLRLRSEPTLEQLATYGSPGRDPRGRVVSVAHLAVLPEAVAVRGGSDAAAARWVAVDRVGPLAFDHALILADGVERLRSKLEYTALATSFLDDRFPLSRLRGVYETVWGRPLDPGNFQRKIRASPDFVMPTGERDPAPARGRPAELFEARKTGTTPLDHPLVRADTA